MVTMLVGLVVGSVCDTFAVGLVGSSVPGGLQLLCTTVSQSSISLSSLSFSSMVNGLLALVTHRCTLGRRQIVSSAVMVFDVVATLGGAVFTTFEVRESPPLEVWHPPLSEVD